MEKKLLRVPKHKEDSGVGRRRVGRGKATPRAFGLVPSAAVLQPLSPFVDGMPASRSSVSPLTPKPTNESGKPVDKKAAGLEGGVKETMLPHRGNLKKEMVLGRFT